MADNFKALIDAELNLNKIESQLKELSSQKVMLDVQLKSKDTGKRIALEIQSGLNKIKVDTAAFSRQLADSFNISDKGVKKKLTQQINDMMKNLAGTWDGKQFDFNKADGFYSGIDNVAKTVTENAKVVQEATGIYDEFFNYFKNKKIYVSEELKNALGDDTYKELLKNNIGKITTDVSKGISIDSLWGEMEGLFPEHFTNNIQNQVDQLIYTFDLLKKAREDITKAIPYNEMSSAQVFDINNSAYDQIITSVQQLQKKLRENMLSADGVQYGMDFNVHVNTEKIMEDIRKALRNISDSADSQIDVKLNFDKSDLSNIHELFRSFASSKTDSVTRADLSIDRKSIEADINRALEGITLPIHFKIDISELQADIQKAMHDLNGVKLNVKMGTNTEQNTIYSGQKTNVSLNKDFLNTLNKINSAGKEGQSVFQAFGGTLREAFQTFTLANMMQDALYKVIDVGRQAVDTVKETNDATTSLQMATGDSYKAVRNLMDSYNAMGKELGALTTEVSTGAEDWLRQGKSISEANTLVKDSMVLSKVADLNPSDATSYLTAMQNGFHKTTEEVNGLVDSLTAIDLVSATDAGGLAEATSRVAATADLAGISFDKLLGYEAAIGEASQEDMSVIGNSMKTILTRMGSIKAGNLELVDEDGTTQTLSDVETVLNNIGVQLRDSTNEFRDFDDVLDDTAAKWDSLSSVQQSAVSQAFAGTFQANRFRLLMENYDKATNYTQVAQNASGTSQQKFEEAYLNSLEAKTNTLRASLEELATSTISDELYAGILDASTGMVNLIDQTGILKASLAGLAGAGGVYVFGQLTGFIKNAVQEFGNFASALDLLNMADALDDTGFKNLMTLTEGLSKSQTKLILSSSLLTDAQRVQILMAQGVSQSEAQAAVAAMGLSSAQTAAAGATATLSNVMKGLWSTLLANPLVLVAAGITAVTAAFNAYQNHMEGITKSAQEGVDAINEHSSSLETQISRVKELHESISSGDLSDEEEYNAKSELLSIQNELVEAYGKQAEGINLVNGSLETQIGLMEQLSDKETASWLNENQEAADNATKEMERKRTFNLGTFEADGSEASKEIEKLFDEYGIKEGQSGTAGVYESVLKFTGDASEAQETIDNFMSDVREIVKEYGSTSLTDQLLSSSADALSKAEEITGEYEEIYRTAQMANMLNDGQKINLEYKGKSATGTYSDLYEDYANAIEDYNTALLSGDTSKIDEAQTRFDAIYQIVQGLGDFPYAYLFEGMADGLDRAAVSAENFRDVLNGEGTEKLSDEYSDKFGADTVEQYAQELKKLNLDETEFKNLFNFGDEAAQGKEAINGIVQAAIDLGVVSGTTDADLQAVYDTLAHLDIVEPTESIDNTTQSLEELKSASSSVTAAIANVNEALNAQTTGKSISLEDYNAEGMEDYKSALEYVNGSLQLNREKVEAITKAKAKEAIANNDAAKAQAQADYLENAEQIDQLQESLKGMESTSQEYIDAQTQISSLESTNQTLIDQCNQYDLLSASIREATGEYQNWLNSQNASESGDMFDDSKNMIQAIDDVNDSDSEDYGKVGTQKYQAAVDFLVPNTVDPDDQEAVNQYINNLKKYFTTDEDGNLQGLNIDQFLSDAVEKGFINQDGDNYEVAGEVTMKRFAKGMNMSLPMLRAVFGELEEYFGDAFNWEDEIPDTMGNLGMQAQSAKEALQSLDAYKDMDIRIDVSDIEGTENKVRVLDNTIAEMDKIKADPKVDTSDYEKANSVIKYCIRQKQELENPVVMKANTAGLNSDINEAVTLYQKFVKTQNKVEERKALGLDTSEAEAKVDKLTGKIQGLDPEINAELEVDPTSAETIQKSLNNMSPEVQAKIDVTTPTGEETETNDVTVNYTANTEELPESFTPLNRTVYYRDDTSNLTTYLAPLYRKVVYTNGGGLPTPPSSGAGTVSGTAHVSGTAKVSGDWGMKERDTVLIGELGREIVVDPNTGKWRTYGDNGAEFANIPRNAIVFNNAQTESLLKQGFVNSRATAMARGTAFANGKAFVTGGFTYKGTSYKGSSSSDDDEKSSSSGSSSKSKSSSKDKDDKKKENKFEKKWEKFQNWVSKFFDHIEKRLERSSALIDKWTTAAENAVTLSAQQTAYSSAITETQTSLSLNETASSKYMKQARKVGRKAVKTAKQTKKKSDDRITQDWVNDIINKLENGSLDITKYKGKERDVIDSLQEWVDKAVDSKDAISELTDSLQDLYTDLRNLANTNAEEKVDKLNEELDILGTQLDRLGTAAEKNNNIVRQNELMRQTMNTHQTARVETAQNLGSASQRVRNIGNAGLTASVNAGQKIEIQDKWSNAWKDAVADYNASLEANATATTNAKKATADYYSTLQENAEAMFNNIASEFEAVQNRISQRSTEIQAAMDLNEAKGYRNSANYYNGMIQAERENQQSLQKERDQLNADLNNKLQTGQVTYGTDAYKNMVSQINDVTNALNESKQSEQEFANAIRELDWSNFDKLQERISDITEESQFFIDELSRRDLVDEDVAGLTDEGHAAMALYAGNYGTAIEQVRQFQDEIDKVRQELSNDPYNETLIDHLQELEEAQRDVISSANDMKDAMIDLTSQALEAQKTALQEIISDYQEMMDYQNDAYDYQKSISDMVMDINNVQKQLSVYAGDDSEESRAKIQQLQSDLRDQQDSLEDAQRQKLTSDINNMFDDLMENYSDYIDTIIDNLDDNFNRLIDAVNMGLADSKETILSLADKLGIDVSDELSTLLKGDNILSNSSEAVENVTSLEDMLTEISNAKSSEEVDQIVTRLSSEESNRKYFGEQGAAYIAAQQKKQELEAQQAAEAGKQSQMPQSGDGSSSGTSVAQNNAKLAEKAAKYIHKNMDPAKKKRKELSDVNKKIYDMTGGQTLSGKELEGLSKKVGVTHNNAKKDGNLYQKLKEIGMFDGGWRIRKGSITHVGTVINNLESFAKGTKSVQKDMLAEIGEEGSEIVYRMADGSVLTPLGKGDMVFTHDMSKNLWELAQSKPVQTYDTHSDMLRAIKEYKEENVVFNNTYGGNSQVVNYFNIQMGDMELHGIEDIEKFRRQFPQEFNRLLKENLINDLPTKGIVKELVNENLLRNHNSLGKNRYR